MQTTKYHIIAVDDEPNILLAIESCFDSNKYKVDSFSTCETALTAMKVQVYDCALFDIRIGDKSGIDLFKQMLSSQITVPVIFMSGNASLNEAAESQKLGAYDFIEKPFSSEKLNITVENCINYNQLKHKLSLIQVSDDKSKLIGEHPLMQRLKSDLTKVSQTDATVFICGESGTGKELIAHEIHKASHRAKNEFVIVNCSAIPENLVESALFGHKKGAFTGAEKTTKGFFELAHRGTIFLDEIGDMPLSAQVSLLRVLEAKEIQKVGADSVIKVDVRVIAATHRNLKQEVNKGTFRQDLYYRISVIPIESPALRERLSDLKLLVSHLIKRLCKRHGMQIKTIEASCLTILEQYCWPGNVRELGNIIERMLIMGGSTLRLDDIPKDILFIQSKPILESSLKAHRANAERELIVKRLALYNGNISRVARSLDIDRTNLHKKIKKYDIVRDKEFY